MILSRQNAWIAGIPQQPEHFSDADRGRDQLRGNPIKERDNRLMKEFLLLVIAEQNARINQDPPHQARSARRAASR